MKALFALAKPFLHALDPEDAHQATIKALQYMPACASRADPLLQQKLFGLNFPHPLGLAAGFDKNAETMRAMKGLGMGHVEIGTVTLRPQAGNDKPRVFRSARDHAVINRMGFPNAGADVFFRNLAAYRETGGQALVGVNIGKNKDSGDTLSDYTELAKCAKGLADYVTINISSPNTPGLRDLQNGDFVRRCLDGTRSVYNGPVLIKLAPDLDEAQKKDLAQALRDGNASGAILTNTTLDRPAHLDAAFASQTGGLSGLPLKHKALETLRAFYNLTDGKIPLIGVGGIDDAEDVYHRILAGASLVQVYTALVFKGPGLISDIVNRLPQLLRSGGFTSLSQAVGADHR